MACAAKPISNLSSSMANNCLISSSSPAIFAVKSHQQISLPLKPIKLHLSASFTFLYASSFSLRRKPNSRTFISAHQEEENTLLLEEDEELSWGIEENQENETVSDWDADAVEDSGTGGEEEYSEPSEDAKIFVGNLPYDVDSEKLAHLFEKAGVVEISEVIYNRETDQSRGFGFVTMSSVEEAEKAVDMFSRYLLKTGTGRQVFDREQSCSKGIKARAHRAVNRAFIHNVCWEPTMGLHTQCMLGTYHGTWTMTALSRFSANMVRWLMQELLLIVKVVDHVVSASCQCPPKAK